MEAGSGPGNLMHHNCVIIWLEMLEECFEHTLGGRKGSRNGGSMQGWLTGGWFRAAFVSFIGDISREFLEHGNLPSKAASRPTAHALITGDCDLESFCIVTWMKRDRAWMRETKTTNINIHSNIFFFIHFSHMCTNLHLYCPPHMNSEACRSCQNRG